MRAVCNLYLAFHVVVTARSERFREQGAFTCVPKKNTACGAPVAIRPAKSRAADPPIALRMPYSERLGRYVVGCLTGCQSHSSNQQHLCPRTRGRRTSGKGFRSGRSEGRKSAKSRFRSCAGNLKAWQYDVVSPWTLIAVIYHTRLTTGVLYVHNLIRVRSSIRISQASYGFKKAVAA